MNQNEFSRNPTHAMSTHTANGRTPDEASEEPLHTPRLLQVAFLVGLAGDLLLRAVPWGLNAALWLWGLLGVVAWAGRRHRRPWSGTQRFLFILAMLCAASLAFRDSAALKSLSILLACAALALLLFTNPPHRLASAGLAHYLGSFLSLLVRLASGWVGLLPPRWIGQDRKYRWSRVQLVLIGLIISLPVVFVFTLLLASADVIFAKYLEDFASQGFETLVAHLALTLALTWATAGLLHATVQPHWGLRFTLPAPRNLGQSVIIHILLMLLNLLFFSFVLVQFGYLFSGATTVQALSGLTYAAYARRGFFQLVAVVTLAMPLLLACEWLLRNSDNKSRKVFRALATFMLLMLLVMAFSAFWRLNLYQEVFGLTLARVYAASVELWLVLAILWFGWTSLRGRSERFTVGAWVSAVLIVASLHALNPEALIVRVNTQRWRSRQAAPEEQLGPSKESSTPAHPGLDATYLLRLGADAVPALVAELPRLQPAQREKMVTVLLRQWQDRQTDWRTWSVSRAQAQQTVQLLAQTYPVSSAPAPAR